MAQKTPPPAGLPPALLAQHAAGDYCEPLDDLVHGQDWQSYRLPNDTTLYMVPCAAGAYNFSYMLYTSSGGSDYYVRLLFVDYFDEYGWMGTDQLFGAYFDPGTLTLTSFYKLRGLGDCGTSGVWRWREYGFALLEFYAKSECDGEGELGEFPQVFPPQ